ncbi:hypothetical protein ACFU5O_32505 [Streptomyces sp. NPDC057445]|uniref:hypothetical protein n=1 Tax=Streptomyces sp. NPDC057445 TaxID=3346136 RepID=UPI0036D1704D
MRAGPAAGLSFAGDVLDAADYPHLGQAHLLADRQEQVEEAALETGLRACWMGRRSSTRRGCGGMWTVQSS